MKVGARDSKLSLIQAEGALQKLAERFGVAYELVPFSSPGDRDQATDLRQSPGDFFTRDLDEAVLKGTLDCAIHSAKDLPAEMPAGLDWFWLPWREDPRDCLVSRVAEPKRIGVSSERRATWAKAHFPEAELLTLRGAIPARLAKLDADDYDAILVAAAALHRLGLSDRITRYIPLEELTPPPGQGVLAITFRKADARMRAVRNLFVKAVRFVGAGVGDAELCTLAGLRALQTADVVIYDALLDASLLDRSSAEKVYVGKRCGTHAMAQAEITALIGERVRRGQRVVRLKGGDPGLFGRLAEETDALSADGLPFVVLPGVSALQAATTSTGLLLTRRAESKGFSVTTPRSTAEATSEVFFMAMGMLEAVLASHAPETPAAIVYEAGAPTQEIVQGTLAELAKRPRDERPGLLILGPAATHRFPQNGPLAGRRIWVTGSASVAEKARTLITDFGGRPIVRPLIRFVPTASVKIRPSKAYSVLAITSPTAARMLLQQMTSPIQYLPKKLWVTGPATAEALASLHIDTLCPEADFSAKGLLAALPEDLAGQKVLRIRSEEAGEGLAEALRARGAKVKDLPIYRTEAVEDVAVPPHDAVFLASSSAAKAWLALETSRAVDVLALGEPTAETLRSQGVEPRIIAHPHTVEEVIVAYACALSL